MNRRLTFADRHALVLDRAILPGARMDYQPTGSGRRVPVTVVRVSLACVVTYRADAADTWITEGEQRRCQPDRLVPRMVAP